MIEAGDYVYYRGTDLSSAKPGIYELEHVGPFQLSDGSEVEIGLFGIDVAATEDLIPVPPYVLEPHPMAGIREAMEETEEWWSA